MNPSTRGYVVIAPDYPSFGDSSDHKFATDGFDRGAEASSRGRADGGGSGSGGESPSGKGKSKTPALDSFGRDLTELAHNQRSSFCTHHDFILGFF